MDDVTLEARNAEAISRAHERYLNPPADCPMPRNPFAPPLGEEDDGLIERLRAS